MLRRLGMIVGLVLAPMAAWAEPLVAAASNVQGALDEIIAGFTAQTGVAVKVSYGATGNLSRQIIEGAPFQVFLAADEASVDALVTMGLTKGPAVIYATGQLALLVPKGGPVVADAGLEGLRAALAAGTVGRFAIANPEHAPYGMRAREALVHAGLWDAVQPRLVLGESVAQAAQFVTSGNAAAGVVALSVALNPAVLAVTDHAALPQDWHEPLTQGMVVLPGADADAVAFADYVRAEAARAVWQRHGYSVP